jgi:hypothetical protein
LGPLESSLCAVYGASLISINPKSIQVWDLEKKSLQKEYAHEMPSLDPSLFLIQEDFIFYARECAIVQLKTQTLEIANTFTGESKEKIIAFHRERNFLVVGHLAGKISLWNLQTNALLTFDYPSEEILRKMHIHKSTLYLVLSSKIALDYVGVFNLEVENLVLFTYKNVLGKRFLATNRENRPLCAASEIYSIAVTDEKICLGFGYLGFYAVEIYDAFTYRPLSFLNGTREIQRMRLFNDLLIGSTNTHCLFWDIKQPENMLNKLETKLLFFNETKIYSLEKGSLFEYDFSKSK